MDLDIKSKWLYVVYTESFEKKRSFLKNFTLTEVFDLEFTFSFPFSFPYAQVNFFPFKCR